MLLSGTVFIYLYLSTYKLEFLGNKCKKMIVILISLLHKIIVHVI